MGSLAELRPKRIGLIAILAVLACPAGARAENLVVEQWTFRGGSSPSDYVVPRDNVVFKNEVNDESLRYRKRDYGIDLGWNSSNTNRDVSLERPGGGASPIVYGERLAVRVRDGGYLRYKEREYGINLVYSSTPVYQWELTGHTPGAVVRTDTAVELYNRAHGDHVVYRERKYGINLRWYADAVTPDGGYPPLPFPQEMRGPSGEPGQILLAGTAKEVKLFHGGTDDELDWHLYFAANRATRTRLVSHLLRHTTGAKDANGLLNKGPLPLTEKDLRTPYCEWMVIDGYHYTVFDDKWFSADVTRTLGLQKSAWRYSLDAANSQNLTGSTEVPKDSRIVNDRARVYLQGAFVNDSEHRFLVEIHPLDSVAYALDASRAPIRFDATDPRWPAERLTWRVAAFSNSTIHRIAKADYLRKTRTTTWYLPLPARAGVPGLETTVNVDFPGFRNNQTKKADGRRPSTNPYREYGVKSSFYAIEPDPRDGVPKLRVTIAMDPPDKFGGMFQAEYTVTVAPTG